MSSLGPRRGYVSLQPCNPERPLLFKQQKKCLLRLFDGEEAKVKQIGSTSISHLSAKPLLDIVVGVPSLGDYKKFVKPLQRFGYEFMPERVFEDREFFSKGPRHKRTHHLNIVESGSAQWHDTLLFRDFLRTHPAWRKDYQHLKETLAELYSTTRQAYTLEKNSFIQSALQHAKHNKSFCR